MTGWLPRSQIDADMPVGQKMMSPGIASSMEATLVYGTGSESLRIRPWQSIPKWAMTARTNPEQSTATFKSSLPQPQGTR